MSLKKFSGAGLIAFAAAILLGIALSAPTYHASYAQAPAPCDISLKIISGGFIIGGSGGEGTLTCQGKRYGLTIGGIKAGAVIGLSESQLYGQAYNVNTPGDVAGTYGAAEAGFAVIRGKGVAKLKNTKGVVLELRGRQVGLEFSVDLGGLVLGLK